MDFEGLLEVACRSLGREEHDGLAVLEVVVNFIVVLAGHLDAVLVDRVVVSTS